MGRNILITGGTTGIGYQLVRRLAQHHQLMVVGRTPNEQLIELEGLTNNVIIVKTDFNNPAKAAIDIDKAMKKAKWDILNNAILNAGTGFVCDPTQEEPAAIRETLNVNLLANIAISRMLKKRLIAGRGKITFIGSMARKGKENFASYAASKAGLHGLARALHWEWRGIVDVQILHLGPTKTQMHKKAGMKLGFSRHFFTSPEGMAAMIEKSIHKRRLSHNLTVFQDLAGSTFLSKGLK